MIRAVFWDSDNTIFETSALHFRKHAEILAPLGIVLTPADEARIRENNGSQFWEILRAEHDFTLEKQDYLDRIDAFYQSHVHEIPMRPGVWTAIEALHRQHIPQAVVSNGRRRSVLQPYEARGIAHYFDFFITIEDCDARKPSPDPYLKALAKLGRPDIQPADCLVIEDDPLGVKAAHDAGMPVIHRLRLADDMASPHATLAVYEEAAFLQAFQKYFA